MCVLGTVSGTSERRDEPSDPKHQISKTQDSNMVSMRSYSESQLLVVNEAEARGFEAEQGLMIMNSCRSDLSLHYHTTAFTPRVIFFLFYFVSLFHLFFVFSFKFILLYQGEVARAKGRHEVTGR